MSVGVTTNLQFSKLMESGYTPTFYVAPFLHFDFFYFYFFNFFMSFLFLHSHPFLRKSYFSRCTFLGNQSFSVGREIKSVWYLGSDREYLKLKLFPLGHVYVLVLSECILIMITGI